MPQRYPRYINPTIKEKTNTNLKRLIRSFDLRASECTQEKTWYHYASDEQGSIVFVTDEEEIKNRYEYDAWGNAALCEETVENRYRYTGQQYDPVTQQYYLRARYYNPVIARFTQEDEYRGDGLNLYAYCANNPVVYVDPSGYVGEAKDALGKEAGVENNFVVFNKTHTGSLPVPKGIGPNGGRLQSHHGLQQKWATENLSQYGYDPKLAPTVTIETGIGFPHSAISVAQNARRDARAASGVGKWNSSLQDELGYIVEDFTKAGFSKNTIGEVLEQQYKMLDKLGAPYERIVF